MLLTASSWFGNAQSSNLTGLPDTVAMSNSKPALSRWYIGSKVSTGWFPVENIVPFCNSR